MSTKYYLRGVIIYFILGFATILLLTISPFAFQNYNFFLYIFYPPIILAGLIHKLINFTFIFYTSVVLGSFAFGAFLGWIYEKIKSFKDKA